MPVLQKLPRAVRLRNIHDALKHVYGGGAVQAAVAPPVHTAASTPTQGHNDGNPQPAVAPPASPSNVAAPGQNSAEVAGGVSSANGRPPTSRGSSGGVRGGEAVEVAGLGGAAEEGGAVGDPRQSYGEKETRPQACKQPVHRSIFAPSWVKK